MLYREIIAVCSEIHTKHINNKYTVGAEHRICECYSWWYIKLILGFKRLTNSLGTNIKAVKRGHDNCLG
jgi:hypothetical protein